ncbi:hypothetical protein AVEN_258888-1 [Araneus ventricosus]|uniref:Uncharacterized protein n=1 Tax=Araneus ventricosus TaxID=182803 RepID=A0A4Y2X5V5_ARAVE|nr:hypothetical protein AVEN_258888-1 [Araneus ventricosus]
MFILIVSPLFADGLLLSELLYSNGVRVIHIEVQVVCEAFKILEHYFSTFGSSNLSSILLISLEDREEIDQLLMSLIFSKGVKALVVGGLQKWQDRLLEAKAYEIHLIMVTHYKESEQPVGSSPTKEDNSINGSKSEDVYTVWKSFLADEGSQKLRQVAVWTNDSGLMNTAPEVDTITVRVALVEVRSLPFSY